MPPILYALRTSIDRLGAFGVLLNGYGREFAVFAEGVSPESGVLVIPPGDSICTRGYYYHGDYSTHNIIVSGHKDIKFHKGSFKRDSKACIIIAEKFSMLSSEP